MTTTVSWVDWMAQRATFPEIPLERVVIRDDTDPTLWHAVFTFTN